MNIRPNETQEPNSSSPSLQVNPAAALPTAAQAANEAAQRILPRLGTTHVLRPHLPFQNQPWPNISSVYRLPPFHARADLHNPPHVIVTLLAGIDKGTVKGRFIPLTFEWLRGHQGEITDPDLVCQVLIHAGSVIFKNLHNCSFEETEALFYLAIRLFRAEPTPHKLPEALKSLAEVSKWHLVRAKARDKLVQRQMGCPGPFSRGKKVYIKGSV